MGNDHTGGLRKSPTGIAGFDEITGGGLPTGRPSLVCGTAGCGKTVFAMEFLVRGAVSFGEPGVFVSFEESADDLARNVASLGFDLGDLVEKKLLTIDQVRVERNEIEETGEYDLDGLFIRLGYAIDSIRANRVVLDTIESLFSALPNEAILRAELRRLFWWLKDRGVTAVITGERGQGDLTRRGLEEYVSDCVILLDQRVREQVTTRRLRIVKYRGSSHSTNEYPFLIQETGLWVIPITSAALRHSAPEERISTGIERLDRMLGGTGVFRGSSVLLSGTAGSGKTSLAANFVAAACRRGERTLFFSFEESEDQIVRNMRSIGLDLAPFVADGRLRFNSSRPTAFGLEMHLMTLHRLIDETDPSIVVIDPVTTFASVAVAMDVREMLVRLMDYLKSRGTTAVLTSLTEGGTALERTDVGISSLIDTWLLLRFLEGNGERNRGLYVLKSRGMPHSNQVREFVMSERGIDIIDVYRGSGGVLTGAARHAQEAQDRADALVRRQEAERRRRIAASRRVLLTARIASLQAKLEAEEAEARADVAHEGALQTAVARERDTMEQLRQADPEADREEEAA
jgi:circadian clock protein KaiC